MKRDLDLLQFNSQDLPWLADFTLERLLGLEFYLLNLEYLLTGADQRRVREASELCRKAWLKLIRLKAIRRTASNVVSLDQYRRDRHLA